MMRRRRRTSGQGTDDDVGGALAGLDAPALRTLFAETIRELDERAYTRAVRRLVERAARASGGWTPPPVDSEDVADVLAFAKAACRAGYTDAEHVDDHLGRASNAFLLRDYAAAHCIFGALLPAIRDREIDLGQRKLADEVLGTDLHVCCTQYAVAAYLTSTPAERPQAVFDAIREVEGLAYFHRPLAEMEHEAVEPLPDFEGFVEGWRTLLEPRSPTSAATAGRAIVARGCRRLPSGRRERRGSPRWREPRGGRRTTGPGAGPSPAPGTSRAPCARSTRRQAPSKPPPSAPGFSTTPRAAPTGSDDGTCRPASSVPGVRIRTSSV